MIAVIAAIGITLFFILRWVALRNAPEAATRPIPGRVVFQTLAWISAIVVLLFLYPLAGVILFVAWMVVGLIAFERQPAEVKSRIGAAMRAADRSPFGRIVLAVTWVTIAWLVIQLVRERAT